MFMREPDRAEGLLARARASEGIKMGRRVDGYARDSLSIRADVVTGKEDSPDEAWISMGSGIS